MIAFVLAFFLFLASAGWGQAALIGHWTLDSTLADSAGANTLTYGGGGTPSYAPGKFGDAGVLGGANWYDTGVTGIGGTTLFAGAAQSWSVSAWFNVTSGNTGTIVAKAGGTLRTFQLFTEVGRVRVILRDSAISDTATGFDDGQWHHAVVTWNGSTGILYVDGAVAIASLGVGTAAEQTTENIIIGARTGGAGFRMTGSLDDVRIFDHALSATEVADLFDPPPPPPPPGSDLDIDVTRVPLRVGTGTQDITFSNFDEDCTLVTCAALFIMSTGVTNGSRADDAMIGMGFTDGTTSTSTAVRDDTGVATTNSFRGQRAPVDAVLSVTFVGSEGLASFSAWLTNGIRINVTNAFPAQYLLTVVLFGGSNLSADVGSFLLPAAQNSAVDVTTVGFTADLVFLMGARLGSTGNSGAPTFLPSFGVAVNDGLSTQGSIGCFSNDADTTAGAGAITSSLYALQYIDNDGDLKDAAAEVSGWDSQGFTATTREDSVGADFGTFYLALGLGGIGSTMVDIATPTATGADTVLVGFQSLFGMVFGTLAQVYEAGESDSDGGLCMLSVATADTQYATFTNIDDGVATTFSGSVSVDRFLRMDQDDGTCNAGTCIAGDLVSFGATGWNLNYTHVFSGASRRLVGLAIESPSAPPAPSARRRMAPFVQ